MELKYDCENVFLRNEFIYGIKDIINNAHIFKLKDNEIDIYDLLYQSVILNIPNKKVCGINCSGDRFLKEESLSDPRLNVFKNIQIEPKNK